MNLKKNLNASFALAMAAFFLSAQTGVAQAALDSEKEEEKGSSSSTSKSSGGVFGSTGGIHSQSSFGG